MWNKLYNYVKHSGVTVTLIFNPLHWRFVPYFFMGTFAEWPDENAKTLVLKFLFIRFEVYIDDGSW